MASQQDIVRAIDGTERKLFAIAAHLRAYADAPVGEGNWTVREMVCHVATTANYEELFRRAHEVGGGFPTIAQMDSFNDQLLQERRDATVDDLLDEAARGYDAARTAARKLSNEEVARSGPADPGEEPMAIGDLLVFLYDDHANSHINTIERAVGVVK